MIQRWLLDAFTDMLIFHLLLIAPLSWSQHPSSPLMWRRCRERQRRRVPLLPHSPPPSRSPVASWPARCGRFSNEGSCTGALYLPTSKLRHIIACSHQRALIWEQLLSRSFDQRSSSAL